MTGMRLEFHQKSGSSNFFGILDFQRSNILLEMNRSLSLMPATPAPVLCVLTCCATGTSVGAGAPLVVAAAPLRARVAAAVVVRAELALATITGTSCGIQVII